MSKLHINGLDSLRAVAAIVVVLGHIEFIKNENNISNCFTSMPDGHLGVILFFVISGFLITSLLLREQQESNTISIKKFYIRRVLRIWPLYYLVLILSLFIFNYHPSATTLVLCLTFFPNIAHITSYGWAVSPQVWSIGVEEQFYLVWPSLVKYVKTKLLPILIAIAVGYTFVFYFALIIINRTSLAGTELPTMISYFYYTAKFNCMALGGILAYLVTHNNRIIHAIRNRYVSVFFMILPFVLWAFNVQIPFFTDEMFALLFCFLIANIINQKHVFFDNRVVSFLGKISYGIYMYHFIIVTLLFRWLMPLFHTGFYFANIIFYVSALFFTILISAVSYYTIENYFLRLKKRFEII